MHNDFIMRIIDQFIQALLAIMSARKAGKHDEAFAAIQTASKRYLDTDIESLLTLSPKQLLEQFQDEQGRIYSERCLICADLIHEVALINDARQSEKASIPLKILCLHLYINALIADEHWRTPDRIEKIDALRKTLVSHNLPQEVQESLQLYRSIN